MRKSRTKKPKRDKVSFLVELRCVEIDGQFCVFKRKDGGWEETGEAFDTCEQCMMQTGTDRCFKG